jgi:glutaconate CoA-transferase subunit A
MPALHLDAAFVHLNRADARGNAAFLGPDLYFDDLFCLAADRAFLSCERIVGTADLTAEAPLHAVRINRSMIDGVVEAPGGAHFTSCVPDYGRDEMFQAAYAATATDGASWETFVERFIGLADAAAYRAAVDAWHEETGR